MILPRELISIVGDYLYADISEEYEVILRPAKLYQCVWEDDEMFIVPCISQ